MILRRYGADRTPDGAGGFLVVEHRAEIARVKPVFKEVKLNLFSPMASERNAPPFWSILKSERY
jgi:hypothetical protein